MLSLQDVVKGLQDRRPGKVAEFTGLTHPTIAAIRDGVNVNPQLSTLQKLSDYLTQDSVDEKKS